MTATVAGGDRRFVALVAARRIGTLFGLREISVVSTPKPIGTPVVSWTFMMPRAHSPAT